MNMMFILGLNEPDSQCKGEYRLLPFKTSSWDGYFDSLIAQGWELPEGNLLQEVTMDAKNEGNVEFKRSKGKHTGL